MAGNTDELAVLDQLRHLLTPDRWYQNALDDGGIRMCGIAALNMIDHDHVEFIGRFTGQRHRKAVPLVWRFTNPVVSRVHQRLSKLARRRMRLITRMCPRWLCSPLMMFNDTEATRHDDIVALIDNCYRSFGGIPPARLTTQWGTPMPVVDLKIEPVVEQAVVEVKRVLEPV